MRGRTFTDFGLDGCVEWRWVHFRRRRVLTRERQRGESERRESFHFWVFTINKGIIIDYPHVV